MYRIKGRIGEPMMNKNLIVITILSLCLIIFGIVMTVFGIMKLSNITVERNFPSHILDEEQNIIIYTPPGYSLKLNQKYPVLYLLDGENYFKERKEERRAEWSMQKTLDRLIKEERIQEMIVVGIYSTENRIKHYTPSLDQEYHGGGNALDFSRFITNELKTFIDRRYRTKAEAEYTGIAGSSLGGLTSLYIGWKQPEVFSKIGSLSPYLWWNNYDIIPILQSGIDEKNVKVWLDAGKSYDSITAPISDEQMAIDVKDLKEYLVSIGHYSERDIYIHQQEKVEDPAQDLDKRLESLLLFLFSK